MEEAIQRRLIEIQEQEKRMEIKKIEVQHVRDDSDTVVERQWKTKPDIIIE